MTALYHRFCKWWIHILRFHICKFEIWNIYLINFHNHYPVRDFSYQVHQGQRLKNTNKTIYLQTFKGQLFRIITQKPFQDSNLFCFLFWQYSIYITILHDIIFIGINIFVVANKIAGQFEPVITTKLFLKVETFSSWLAWICINI